MKSLVIISGECGYCLSLADSSPGSLYRFFAHVVHHDGYTIIDRLSEHQRALRHFFELFTKLFLSDISSSWNLVYFLNMNGCAL